MVGLFLRFVTMFLISRDARQCLCNMFLLLLKVAPVGARRALFRMPSVPTFDSQMIFNFPCSCCRVPQDWGVKIENGQRKGPL